MNGVFFLDFSAHYYTSAEHSSSSSNVVNINAIKLIQSAMTSQQQETWYLPTQNQTSTTQLKQQRFVLLGTRIK